MLKSLFVRFLTRKSPTNIIEQAPLEPSESTVPDSPRGFGYKCNWFAVKTTETDELAEILGLTEMAPGNWEHGIHHAYRDKVFISPPVDGWTFIIGTDLPFPDNDASISIIKAMLIDLSTNFGQAQYFGTYRVSGCDSWMKAANGKIERAYAVADGTNTIIEGEITEAEKKYNLFNSLSEEYNKDPNYHDRTDIDYPDESMTMEIAEAWGISPIDLEMRTEIASRTGILGYCRNLKHLYGE